MKLGGWQRLWIVIAGMYLIVVIVFFVMTVPFPNPQNVPHSPALYEQLSPESKKILYQPTLEEKIDLLNRKSEVKKKSIFSKPQLKLLKAPNGHEMYFKKQAAEEEMQDVKQEYWNIVKKEATKERIKYLGLAFLIWFAPVLALYVFGWLVGWVYRGFKQ